jgi:hypothetical protein
MGIVFEGVDARLARPVAIKLVRTDVDRPAYRERLLREAQAMARLEHPNVVKVYEIGEDAGRLFVAMELVEGTTLSAWLRARHPWRDVVAMFLHVGAGLAAVHAAGLVHRDFKPDNVLVDRDGRARVADFGIARLERERDASPLGKSLTETGALMGTPGYMAPEQQFGGTVDARADQYSFCVALREALGGRPIDDARWSAAPRALRAIVTRGLAYDPSERFPTLDALLAALRRVRGPRRSRYALAVALVVVGGASTAAIVVAGARDEAKPPATTIAEVAHRDAGVRDAPVAQVAAAPADAARAATIVDAGIAKRTVHDAGAKRVAQTPVDPVELSIENVPGKDYKGLHKPAANVDDPAHLPAVRATLRDLGYGGVDLAAIDRDPAAAQSALEAEVANGSGDDARIARTKLGMVERRRGDCKHAQDAWRGVNLRGNDFDAWYSRATLGFAICDLETGHVDDAYSVVMKAWKHDNPGELQLVMAIIAYDRGDHRDAHNRMVKANGSSDPRVHAALKTWLDATGLVL